MTAAQNTADAGRAWRVLNVYVKDRKDRKNFADPVTASEWAELLKDFPQRARHQAADLAAHNWDVAIVGGRLLIHTRWGTGKWWDKDAATPIRMTEDEYLTLYGRKLRPSEEPSTSPDYAALAAAKTGGQP